MTKILIFDTLSGFNEAIGNRWGKFIIMKRFVNRSMGIVTLTAAVLFLLTVNVYAIPTVFNNVPSTDVTGNNTLVLMFNYYKYAYKTQQAADTASMMYGVEYGYKKLELGGDFIASRSFVDNGNYPGRSNFNFKWRILTQGSDEISMAVGAMYLGSEKYTGGQYYYPSPYVVFSKAFKSVRLHLGYQNNILGFKRADLDNKNSRGLIAAIDGVVWKHPVRPVSLMLDYAGGPLATYGVGISQPLNSRVSWFYCFYKPVHDPMPLSQTESPKQHWLGLTYSMPLR